MAHDAMVIVMSGVGLVAFLFCLGVYAVALLLAMRMRGRGLIVIAGRAMLGGFSILLLVGCAVMALAFLQPVGRTVMHRFSQITGFGIITAGAWLVERELVISASLLVQAYRERESMPLFGLAAAAYGLGLGSWILTRAMAAVTLFSALI